MKSVLLLAFLCGSLAVFAQTPLSKGDAEALKERLEGAYDTEEQAKADFSLPKAVLHIREIDLKGKQPGGYWLYWEQALASSADVPYRQEILHLYKKDRETLALERYLLPDPLRFTGAWYAPELLKKLRLDSLRKREGCVIYIHKDAEGQFRGSTAGQSCDSTGEGLHYTRTDMRIYPNMLVFREWVEDRSGTQTGEAGRQGLRFRKFTLPRKVRED